MSDLPLDPPELDEAGKTMQPLDSATRHRLAGSSRRTAISRPREPIQAFTEAIQPLEETLVEELLTEKRDLPRAGHRQADPLVAYLLLVALGIGVSPLEPMIRYTVLWTLMALLGAVAYLLGEAQEIREAKIDDLFWGVAFGFLASFPFLLGFGSALATVSVRMFDVDATPNVVMDTWVFLAVMFVIPLSETLFFRGGMQGVRSLFLTSLLATLWSAVLFFPHMELGGRTAIAMIMLIVFALLNFMYSYVKFRNGLAAAWLSQVVSYTMLWFVPRILF